MSNIAPDFTNSLLDQFSEEANGSGLVNGMGLASALMLMQEQASQGLPTLSPVTLALETLSLNILSLEPGLTSLAAAVPPPLLASLQDKAESLSWAGLMEQAQQLSSELIDVTGAVDGLPDEALGLESLPLLQEDLQGLGVNLPDVMDMSPLDTSSSIVASLNDGTSLFDAAPIEQTSASIAHAAPVAAVSSGTSSVTAHPFETAQTAPSQVVAVDDVTSPIDAGAPLADGPAAPAPAVPAAALPSTGAVGVSVAAGAAADSMPATAAPAAESVGALSSGSHGGEALAPVSDLVVGVVDTLEGAIGEDALAPVSDLVDGVFDAVEGVLGGDGLAPVSDLVGGLPEVVDGVANAVEGLIGDGALAPVSEVVDGVGDVVGEVFGGVTGVVEGVLGGSNGLEPVNDLVDDVLGGEVLEPVSDIVGGVADLVGGVLGGETGLLGGEGGASLVDELVSPGEPDADLVDSLAGLDVLTEPVTDVLSNLPLVDEVLADLPLVGGILPLVSGSSGEDASDSVWGGLLG